MNGSNKIIFNTGVLYVKMVITLIVTLYATRISLKALGSSDLGIFFLVAGVIGMLSFLNTAMAISTQRFLSFYIGKNDQEKLKEIFDSSVVLHLLVGILLVIILELLGIFLFDGVLNIPENRIASSKLLYHFMVISSFITVISVPYNAIINSHENMLLFSVLSIVESIGKLLIAFAITMYDNDRLILYGLLLTVLTFIIFFAKRQICNRQYIECKGKLLINKNNKVFIKEMFGFAGWNMYGTMSGVIRSQGITVVLNFFFGTVVNAAYGIANQVNGQLSYFSSAVLMAFNPQIMKSEGSGERERMLNLSKLTSKFSFLLLSFFTIPLIIEIDYVMKLWLDDVPEYTIIFCKLILFLTLINQLTIGLQSSAQAVGKIKIYQLVIGTINLLAPVIGFLCLKYGKWDAYIVIVVTIIVEVIAGIWRIIFLNKLSGLSIKEYVLEVLKPSILIFVIVYFITVFLNNIIHTPDFIRLLITTAISTVLLATGIYKFGLSEAEKEKILIIYKKIKKNEK